MHSNHANYTSPEITEFKSLTHAKEQKCPDDLTLFIVQLHRIKDLEMFVDQRSYRQEANQLSKELVRLSF